METTHTVPDILPRLFGHIVMGWNADSCQLLVKSNSTRSFSATFVDAVVVSVIVVWRHNVHYVGWELHLMRCSRRYFYLLVHHFALWKFIFCAFAFSPLFVHYVHAVFVILMNWREPQ